MSETMVLALEKEWKSRLTNDAQSIRLFLNEHHREVERLLGAYWYRKKGTVMNVEIPPALIRWTSTTEGEFVARYEVSFFFACDDTTSHQVASMKIHFRYHEDEVMLVGEEEQERIDEL